MAKAQVSQLEVWAQLGWKLLPCKPNSKRPLLEDWPARASSDLSMIRDWAAKHPGCNWGVATGLSSGVFVLDVDGVAGTEALARLESKYGPLPTTLTSLTGGGEHRYFNHPPDRDIRGSRGKLGDHLDVRGERSQAIIPPSIHQSGRPYQWVDAAAPIADAPDWLLDLVASTPHHRVECSVESAHPTRPPNTPKLAPRFDGARDQKNKNKNWPAPRFEVLLKGERDPGLFRHACRLRRRGAERSEIEDLLLSVNEQRCKPPLPQEKVIEIATYVARRYQPGGPDSLASAWKTVLTEQHKDGYSRFLALARHLQRGRPSRSIALPVERIGELMRVHRTQVGRWRRYALREGWLHPAEPAIPHQLAACFFFIEISGVP